MTRPKASGSLPVAGDKDDQVFLLQPKVIFGRKAAPPGISLFRSQHRLVGFDHRTVACADHLGAGEGRRLSNTRGKTPSTSLRCPCHHRKLKFSYPIPLFFVNLTQSFFSMITYIIDYFNIVFPYSSSNGQEHASTCRADSIKFDRINLLRTIAFCADGKRHLGRTAGRT